MVTPAFDRDAMARWYATNHLQTDPGLGPIVYLPGNAPDREIRLVEVNRLMPSRTDESIEPLDFGIERGTPNAHLLCIVDVTVDQWERIKSNSLRLPTDWSLDRAIEFPGRGLREKPLSATRTGSMTEVAS